MTTPKKMTARKRAAPAPPLPTATEIAELATDLDRVLRIIRRTVDEALERVVQATPGDDPRPAIEGVGDRLAVGLRARIRAAAASARAGAGELRDLDDLQELHDFCCGQIDSYERMALATLGGVIAAAALTEVQRTLNEARVLPARTSRNPPI